ncbi:hypothetical protein F511_34033 [Dorcoceras hygrometricum]|uniref:Uncharacterized protein n=1 Tax=Dorcoceras hygrometricum TaxID=472368 RepID=A0A2Z7CFP9_9LAMI|nr:hypothetical protein F511_34033 [Dorcoceras hygrometricum]
MSLFDLQDVCIAIGSIATLDLPMVVDLIGIYGLKGPYSLKPPPPSLSNSRRRRPPCAAAAARHAPPPPPVFAGKFVSGQFNEENPFVLISSVLLVQADEGVSILVVDRIGDIYRSLPRRADVIVTTVGARHKCQQDSIGYPRMKAGGESSTTKHRLLHASGPHPIPPPNDPKTNQYNQDLGLIHSTNGNHLESPNEGSSIDHQVTIHLHAQNITIFPTNETWYFTSHIIVSSSGGLILISTVQSTRNEFRIYSDY